MSKNTEKICGECGETFNPNHHNQKFCSKDHYRNCVMCNASFLWRPKKTDVCSISCGVKKKNLEPRVIKNPVQRVCKLCKNDFTASAKSKAQYCSNPHSWKCFNCETEIFVSPNPKTRRYICKNSRCRAEMLKLSSLEKFGVENPSQTEMTRKKISAKKKSRTQDEIDSENAKREATLLKRYGVKAPLQAEAFKAKMQETSREKYGMDNPGQSERAKAKARETNLEKYGVEYTFQADSVKEKIKETMIERYGVEHVMQSEELKKKVRETNLERYGTENAGASKVVQERIKETNLAKYGVEHSFQALDVKDKIKATNLERYGVENVAQSGIIQERMKETNLERYGVENGMQSDIVKEKLSQVFEEKYGVKNPSSRNVLNYSDYQDFVEYVKANPSTIKDLAEYFNVTDHTIRKRIISNDINEYVIGRYKSSVLEEKFAYYFKTREYSFKRNDRTILDGKEIDFYFEDAKLGVEISPSHTHHSLPNGWGNRFEPKVKNYHKEKFLKAAEKGVELITIFDWHDWDKAIEMIEQKLNTSIRIPARKTVYKEFSRSPELRKFVDDWHLLGMAQNLSIFKYGVLEFENEIVSIAVWCKTNDSSKVELKRLVSKPGYTVVGGASKLEKNFLKNNHFNEIITFSDCDLGWGSVYKKLGYKLIEESAPQINYYHTYTRRVIKHLSLVSQGADRLLKNHPNYTPVGQGDDLPSNKEILLNNGFLLVYDCGYRKWVKSLTD